MIVTCQSPAVLTRKRREGAAIELRVVCPVDAVHQRQNASVSLSSLFVQQEPHGGADGLRAIIMRMIVNLRRRGDDLDQASRSLVLTVTIFSTAS